MSVRRLANSRTPLVTSQRFLLRFFSHAPLRTSDDLRLKSQDDSKLSTDGTSLFVRSSVSQNQPFVFPASWLWVNDPASIHETSGQRLRTLGRFNPINTRIQEVQIRNDYADCKFRKSPPGSFHSRGGVYAQLNGVLLEDEPEQRNIVHIKWSSGEQSIFDLEWLMRCHPVNSLESGISSTQISSQLAIGSNKNSAAVPVPTMDYNQFQCDESEATFQALHSIVEQGVVLIQNAPTNHDDAIVAGLGRLMGGGYLSHGSLYGDTFHVQSQQGAHNIAYTSVALPPHQDLTYYESKPFLQLLHCIHQSLPGSEVTGGESVLVDAMAAAEYLRVVAPDLFKTLCRTEATFLKQREGADMVSFKPHIQVSRGEVVAVHWSPPFEGPMQMASSLQEMEEYAMAYQAMECLLDNSLPRDEEMLLPLDLQQTLRRYAEMYTWERSLQSGEVLVFNNQRMVHGRRSFHLHGTANRHLVGCYTDAMETIGQYRLLLRDRKETSFRVRNQGNGTRGTDLVFHDWSDF